MKIISLGLGVQSTALYLMSSLGKLERADYAIFADPGAELPRTYEILDLLKEWAKDNNGIPIVVTKKNLYKDLIDKKNSYGGRWASIPAFTKNGKGMLRRQCTKEYKVNPIIKKIRELRGIKKHKHLPHTEVWLGISLDEIQRMKTSTMSRITYNYPLIDNMMTRSDCTSFFESVGFPTPPKSSCVFCPYHANSQWLDIKQNCKKSWDMAVLVDESIRNLKSFGVDDELYVHRSGIPLADAALNSQQELFMCEEGFCGI